MKVDGGNCPSTLLTLIRAVILKHTSSSGVEIFRCEQSADTFRKHPCRHVGRKRFGILPGVENYKWSMLKGGLAYWKEVQTEDQVCPLSRADSLGFRAKRFGCVVVKEIALSGGLKVLSGHHRTHLIKIRVCRSNGGIMRRR